MTGKIALVAGASRGLDRTRPATSPSAAWRCSGLTGHLGNESRALVREIEAAGGRVAALPLAFGRTDDIARFAAAVPDQLDAAFGRRELDFPVNNAGTAVSARFTKTTAAQLDEMMQVHVKAPFFLTQALLPLMVDGGAIVNAPPASRASRCRPRPPAAPPRVFWRR